MTKVTKNSFSPNQIPLDLINEVRKQNPLIHNITNLVSANFTANGLLAVGASPMMVESPLEMAELARISSAVVLNIGTPSDPKTSAMIIAGQTANAHGIPVVLDPVAVSASTLRQSTIHQIGQVVQFDAIRGNAGELVCEGLSPSQSGTFMYQFLDKLGGITPDDIVNRIKFVGEKA